MKNKKKQQQTAMPKFVMTITIILMIGTLLGTVGYLATRIPCGFVAKNKDLKKPARNDINNWKVYSDEKYNFQIKYPADIYDPAAEENENAGKKEIQKEINFKINDDLKISIFVWNMEASEKDGLAEAKEKYDEVSINGVRGWQSRQSRDSSAAYFFETYLYSKTHIYQIEYRGVYNIEDFDLYQKMVSTFEFMEKDETANWQTYKNEEYGFEIKYPQNFYKQEGKYENEEYRLYWIDAADSKWKDQWVHNPSLIVDVIKTDLKPKEYLNKTGSSKSILDDTDPCPANFTYCSLKYLEYIGIGADQIPSLQFYSAAVSGSDYHTVVRNGEFLIDIRAHSSGNGDFSTDIYNQILSTFKFAGK